MTCINVFLPLIVYYTDQDGNLQLSGTKTAVAAAVLSILAFALYMVCYFLTTERVKIPSTADDGLRGFGKALKNTLGNRATIGVAIVVILYEIGNQGLHGMSAYLYPNYLQNVAAQSASGVIETVITLLMTLTVVPLVKKFGKREAASLGIGFSAVMLLICYFTHMHSAVVWLVFYGLVTAGLGIWGPVQWSLVGDIVDDTEIRTGTRADGGIYGIFSITTLFPFVIYVLMVIVLMTIYPLSKKRVEENAKLLEQKHAAEAADE